MATSSCNAKAFLPVLLISFREELLAIKAGKKEYDDLLQMADDLITSIEKHYLTSNLSDSPDAENAIVILIGIREELYR